MKSTRSLENRSECFWKTLIRVIFLISGMDIGCSFMRDGLSISTEDKFNMLFGAVFKEIKEQIPDDLKEIVKTANLDKNEQIFKAFVNWENLVQDEETKIDLNNLFDFKQFENKKLYNQIIGNILKLYINQGNQKVKPSFFESNSIQSLRN